MMGRQTNEQTQLFYLFNLEGRIAEERRMKKTTIILAALLMTSTAAYSSSVLDGNSLLSDCQSDDQSFCLGYALGVETTMRLADLIGKSCIPDGVTAEQLAEVAIRYLKANPKNRHFGAQGLLIHAFNKAWPCK